MNPQFDNYIRLIRMDVYEATKKILPAPRIEIFTGPMESTILALYEHKDVVTSRCAGYIKISEAFPLIEGSTIVVPVASMHIEIFSPTHERRFGKTFCIVGPKIFQPILSEIVEPMVTLSNELAPE